MKKITPKIKGMQEKQKRHTHRTAAALEDAIAIQRDIIRVFEDTLEFVRQRVEDAQEVLRTARKGPHEYDPERPSGQRYTIKRR